MADFISPFRIKGVALLGEGVRLLSQYQARLAAQDTRGVLVALRSDDAAVAPA